MKRFQKNKNLKQQEELLIYDIQDYARIQKKQLRLCLTNFYINEIIDEVIDMCLIQAELKGVEMNSYYATPLYQIHSDPNIIKQIIMNYVSNSQNLQSKGVSQQQKTLQGTSQSSTNRFIYTISIEDTGCEIQFNIKPQFYNYLRLFLLKNREQNLDKYWINSLQKSCRFDHQKEQIYEVNKILELKCLLKYMQNFKIILLNLLIIQIVLNRAQRFIIWEGESSSNSKIFSFKQIRCRSNKNMKYEQFLSLGQKLQNFKTYYKGDSQEVQDTRQIQIKISFVKQKTWYLLVDDQIFNLIALKTLLKDLISEIYIIEAYNEQQPINKVHRQQTHLSYYKTKQNFKIRYQICIQGSLYANFKWMVSR
ncbi:unnamed protein product [Paramecium sonneborni]|uniref:Uncharacterized protein n=1 Tax=Paramecium sonneborni TaxID=65129 RepID=A0A8S1QJY7_9CILI|nr:unnamed protein product [Paramecium sonneborni]